MKSYGHTVQNKVKRSGSGHELGDVGSASGTTSQPSAAKLVYGVDAIQGSDVEPSLAMEYRLEANIYYCSLYTNYSNDREVERLIKLA